MSRHPVESPGWDHRTEVVDDRWIERTPLTPATAARLTVEVALMPRLAPRLPLTVPVPVLVGDPPRGRHLLVQGSPSVPGSLTAEDGAAVGRFLRRLHDTPPEVWHGTGLAHDADQREALAALEADVLPLLPDDVRPAGGALVDRCLRSTARTVLRHGDLGPDHLLRTEGRVTGVIDWTDVALGDPAVDLAWTVHGTSRAFSGALVAAYGPTGEELERGYDWHRLGPWWEVRHGLLTGQDDLVRSGLRGAATRLRGSAPGSPAAD